MHDDSAPGCIGGTVRSAVRPLALLVLLVVAAPIEGDARDARSPHDGVLYLLAVRHEGRVLADDVPALVFPDDELVSFAAMLDALEFPIERDGGTWSGWAYAEDNEFHWTMDEDSHAWLASEDGIMVSLASLEGWFDLDLELDRRRQRLEVRTRRPLPYEQRAARQALRRRGHGDARDVEVIEIRDRYRWLTTPMFDVTLDAFWREGRHGGSGSQSLSVDMGLDLLKHSVVYDGTLTHSDDRGVESQQRLTFSRAAPTRTSSMALGITRYAFGDVFSTTRNLVGGGGAGVGFIVDRRRDGVVDTLNQATIVGNGRPGWDVELYRNGQLVDFGQVDVDGRYVFEDQEVLFGENVFVAKLYGPQGQLREERHVVWGGGVDLAAGDHEFTIQHVDFRERLIDGDRGPDELVTASHLSEARFSHAFTDSIQAGLAFSDAGVLSRSKTGHFDDVQHASAFVRADVGRGVLHAELARQLDGGTAWSVQYLAQVLGHRIDVAHQSFGDFESPATRRRERLSSLTQLTASGPIDFWGLEHYTVRATHRDRVDGSSELRLFNRIGGRWSGVFLSNDLEWRSPSTGDDRLRGRLRASGRWGRINVSGLLDYEPTADELLRELQAIFRWRISSALHASTTVRHRFSSDDDLTLDAVLTARMRFMDLSFRASTDFDDDWLVGVSMLFHLGRRGHDRTWFDSDRHLARSGHAELAPFVDRDGDGVRDADEEGVAWFSYKGQESHVESPGILVLPAVPERTAVQLETRHLKLDDPFLVPRDDAYEIYTHAGSHLRVDVPLLLTGDVAGSVIPLDSDDRTPGGVELRGIVVKLLDRHGKTAAVTETEFDGYFSFEAVPAGPYEVLVEHPRRDGVVASRSFEVDPDAGQVVLADFHLDEERLLTHLPGDDRRSATRADAAGGPGGREALSPRSPAGPAGPLAAPHPAARP